MPEPLIALLTDFGTSDPYVGVMKGVMAAHCPDARFIDITHDVSPQNIRQGAYLLRSAYRYFPTHTVFLVVVDPGVGTDRRPVAVKTDHGMFVGPDNGILSGVLDEVDTWQAVTLWPTESMSATFHGRDLFAPTAAALASGAALNTVGSPTNDLIHLPILYAECTEPGRLEGEVIHIDHYGNIITSVGHFDWDQSNLMLDWKSPICFKRETASISIGNITVHGIKFTYGQVQEHELLALINSDRQLEIAVNRGNAAKRLNVNIGDSVTLHFTPANSEPTLSEG